MTPSWIEDGRNDMDRGQMVRQCYVRIKTGWDDTIMDLMGMECNYGQRVDGFNSVMDRG